MRAIRIRAIVSHSDVASDRASWKRHSNIDSCVVSRTCTPWTEHAPTV